jgi:hypothetical protein
MKQQRAAERRERKSRDAGYGGSHENGNQDKGRAFDAVNRQQRAFSGQQAEADNCDDGDGHRTGVEGQAGPEFGAGNKLFLHCARLCSAPQPRRSSACAAPRLSLHDRGRKGRGGS